MSYNADRNRKKKESKKKKEFSMDEVMEKNDVKTPKWIMKVGVFVVAQVMIAGVVFDAYYVYRFFAWLF